MASKAINGTLQTPTYFLDLDKIHQMIPEKIDFNVYQHRMYSVFIIFSQNVRAIKENKQTRSEGLVGINQYFIVGLLIIQFHFTTNLSVSEHSMLSLKLQNT